MKGSKGTRGTFSCETSQLHSEWQFSNRMVLMTTQSHTGLWRSVILISVILINLLAPMQRIYACVPMHDMAMTDPCCPSVSSSHETNCCMEEWTSSAQQLHADNGLSPITWSTIAPAQLTLLATLLPFIDEPLVQINALLPPEPWRYIASRGTDTYAHTARLRI